MCFLLNQRSFTQTPNPSTSHLDGIFWGEAVFRLFYTCNVFKENVKNSPCQHFNIIVIFYLSFIPVHVGLYLICLYQWARIYVNFIIEMDLFPFHLITTFSFWPYILVFAVFLGWQYMFFFSSGQSNPTFCLSKNGKKFVLRKKPPGKLLRGAHQVCLVHTLYFVVWSRNSMFWKDHSPPPL